MIPADLQTARTCPSHSPRRHPARAQTLTELLVVVTIIMVLIALIMPGLRRSLREAATTLCMANLREIHTALQIYRHDHQGWLPTGVTSEEGEETPSQLAWFRQLYPRYLADLAVFSCPEDPMMLAVRSRLMSPPPDDPDDDLSSYGMSDYILSGADGEAANLDRHQPRRPMDTLMLADLGTDLLPMETVSKANQGLSPSAFRSDGRLLLDDGYDPGDPYFMPPWLTDRHMGGINTITIGGAIRPVRTRELMIQPVDSYYVSCATGDCTLCLDLKLPHYSFASAGIYWWTGPNPAP